MSTLSESTAFNTIEPPILESHSDFNIKIAAPDDVYLIKEISEETAAAAALRGTGISGRPPEYLAEKIKNGDAVIALAADGSWAGFSFISSWDQDRYVSNSGLIVAARFRHTGLARKIKEKIFELSRQKYPDAYIFSLTSGLPVMKMNHELGFEPVTYSELPSDENFWKSCQSCVNCAVLESKNRKNCLCTAMRYEPQNMK
ncbi:GNAT family N-acetyltransferase [Flavobacterium sp. KB82]|uniref:GNAT family N-acetyltransferase n=1 Tax=Flavobacterium hungaricum TaxID=2082725 RepID=A0ABR9TGB5_9FLAO|nr:GNAT family N-acetyltransferase [Flavobacterium hungaricum]